MWKIVDICKGKEISTRLQYQIGIFKQDRKSLFHLLPKILIIDYYYQGHVGCLVDTELVQDKHVHTGVRSLYYSHDTSPHVSPQMNTAHETLTSRTPDTSFYQWVPFVLIFQVLKNYNFLVLKLKS